VWRPRTSSAGHVADRSSPAVPRRVVLPNPGLRRVLQAYQLAERFPLFQGIETAIFVVAAIALLGFAAWFVRRRA